MTPFRIVVSWLAFLFLAFRRLFLIRHGIEDLHHDNWKWNPASIFEDSYPTVGRILIWSPLWFVIALLIIAPWLCSWWRSIGKRDEGNYFNEYKAEKLNAIGRWSFSILAITSLFGILPNYLPHFLAFNPDGNSGFAAMIYIVVIGLLAAGCLAPELSAFTSSGFTRFIDAVFFPGGREAKPPYTLKLARFYVEKHRWEEAETEYARVLSFHSDQVEAWQERLTLAFRRRDTPAGSTPEMVLAEALKALKTPIDREAVYQQFTRGSQV